MHLIDHFCVSSSTCACFVLILFGFLNFLSPAGGTLSLIHYSKEAIWLWAPSVENRSRVSIILILKWPTSLPLPPRLLWLARPRAVCHTNSILCGSGVDISPPGETDGTFHYTSKQLQKPVHQKYCRERERVKTLWVKAGMESVLVLILHFFHYSATSLHSVSG